MFVAGSVSMVNRGGINNSVCILNYMVATALWDWRYLACKTFFEYIMQMKRKLYNEQHHITHQNNISR